MNLSGTYSGSTDPSLTTLVKEFPPRLKQAIVGAAQNGLLQRSTWNGCVFNAAGHQVGAGIHSYHEAADVFDMEQGLVNRFIRYWDGMSGTDTECNLRLISAIKDVGLFSEPTTGPLAKRSSAIRGYVVKQVFKSELDKLNEEFQVMAQNVDLTRPKSLHSQLEKDICELVSALVSDIRRIGPADLNLKKEKITLEIEYDADSFNSPRDWNWGELLMEGGLGVGAGNVVQERWWKETDPRTLEQLDHPKRHLISAEIVDL